MNTLRKGENALYSARFCQNIGTINFFLWGAEASIRGGGGAVAPNENIGEGANI